MYRATHVSNSKPYNIFTEGNLDQIHTKNFKQLVLITLFGFKNSPTSYFYLKKIKMSILVSGGFDKKDAIDGPNSPDK